MTLAGVQMPQLTKELQALAPLWLATMFAIVVGSALGIPSMALSGFVLGAAALGAYSTGHEFTYRTMAPLLAQPVERWRVLRAKLLALIPLVIVLAVVTWVVLLESDFLSLFEGRLNRWVSTRDGSQRWQIAIVTMMPLLAVGAAPWLAVLCRSTTAGFVFTLAIPAALWTATHIARAATAGFTTPALEYGPGLTIMVAGIVGAVILTTFVGRRQFLHLEVVEGYERAFRLKAEATERRTRAEATVRRRSHPAVLLVKKELRLYPLALAVAGLYAVLWIAMRLARLDAQIAGQSFQTVAGFYCAFVAMLVGATASAEERALGVTASQTLQPYAFWKQWSIKVVVAVVVAIVLGPALTATMEAAFPLIGDTGRVPFSRLELPRLWIYSDDSLSSPAILVLLSLHISSLCTGTLRALLLTLPYWSTLLWVYTATVQASWRVVARLSPDSIFFQPNTRRRLPTFEATDVVWSLRVGDWMLILTLVVLTAMPLMFGYQNHRSSEPARAAVRQLVWMVVAAFAGACLVHGLPNLVLAYLVRH